MGVLAFMRVYSGKISSRIQLFNSRKNTLEKLGGVYRVRADQYVHV
jgi:translation elongation factor EF-G